VYTHDSRDGRKQALATTVLETLIAAPGTCVSVQCLSEFFNAVRRLSEPVPAADAALEIERFAKMMTVLDLTAAAILAGCQAAVGHQMSIWDALIWAVAKLNGVKYIVTEDSEHGRILDGVHYVNPFDPAFDLGALGA